MRDTVNILFRAAEDGSPRSSERLRRKRVEVLEHNEKAAVELEINIDIPIGEVIEYVKKRRTDFLTFHYVPMVAVSGKIPDHANDFVDKLNEAKPSFKVSLEYKSPNNLKYCRIKEIKIVKEQIDDIVIEIIEINKNL